MCVVLIEFLQQNRYATDDEDDVEKLKFVYPSIGLLKATEKEKKQNFLDYFV